MTRKNIEKTEKVEIELTDEVLEQVSGGFNPQPDPPGRNYAWKLNQHISQPVSLPADKVTVQKV